MCVPLLIIRKYVNVFFFYLKFFNFVKPYLNLNQIIIYTHENKKTSYLILKKFGKKKKKIKFSENVKRNKQLRIYHHINSKVKTQNYKFKRNVTKRSFINYFHVLFYFSLIFQLRKSIENFKNNSLKVPLRSIFNLKSFYGKLSIFALLKA